MSRSDTVDRSRIETTVNVALEILNVVKESTPDPARGALGAISGILSLLQVHIFAFDLSSPLVTPNLCCAPDIHAEFQRLGRYCETL